MAGFRATGIVCLLAVAFSAYKLWEAGQFGALCDTEKAQIAELRTTMKARAPRQMAPSVPRRGALAAAASDAVSRPTPPPGFGLQPKRELSRAARVEWGRRLMADHPDIRQLVLEIHVGRSDVMYRDFLEARGLSVEQITSLEKRIAEETGMEPVWSDYGTIVLPLCELSEAEAARRQDTILREVLGESAAVDFATFSQHWLAHACVQSVAGNLFDADQPLTAVQAQQLEALFRRNENPQKSPIRPWDWEAVAIGARAILSIQQYAAFENQHRLETVGMVK